MKRIILMLLKNLLRLPVYWFKLCQRAKHPENYSAEERFQFLQSVDRQANKAGKISIDVYGQENIPKEDGFMYYPNHQGMYDVLAIIKASTRPFSVVMKKELKNIPGLNKVFDCMGSRAIDREDIKQSMKVILDVAKDVKDGKNYLIFAEGTRTQNPNKVGEFKGGSFKAATKAKCTIVPVALIDCYKPFDTHNLDPVTVQVHFLEPLTYEMYKDMKSNEIAELVQHRIEQTIEAYENK